MELSPTDRTEHDQSKNDNKQSIRRPIIHVFTGFRALACLWIFMYHSAVNGMDEIVKYNLVWVPSGAAAGVVLFFCLSGFVMVWTYGDCEFKSIKCYWSFIGRRAARLFPIYYFSLFLSINDIKNRWNINKSGTTVNAMYTVSTLLAVQTWIPYDFDIQFWNDAIWSVQTEWFFYLVFPFLLRLIRYLLNTTKISLLINTNNKKKALKRLYLLWFVVFCVSILPLLLQSTILNPSDFKQQRSQTVTMYISPLARIPEFILGMITGIIYMLKSSTENQTNHTETAVTIPLFSNDNQQQNNEAPLSSSHTNTSHSKYSCHSFMFDIYFLSGILFFIFICSALLLTYPVFSLYPSIIRAGPLISFIMCTYLYLSARHPLSLASRLLTTPLLINMGDISYAFYCLADALPKVFLLITGTRQQSLIMRLFAGIGIAVFARHYIELPFYTWANKKLPKCQCT